MKAILCAYCSFLLLCIAPITGHAQVDEAVTLEHAVEQVLSFNRSLLSTRLQAQTSQQQLRQVASDFELKVRPDGRANAASDRKDLGGGIRVDKRLSTGTTLGAGMQYSWIDGDAVADDRQSGRLRFEVSQALFRNAGKLVNLEPVVAGELRVIAAERLFEIRKADLVLETGIQFHDVKILERRLQIDQQAVERLQGLAKLTAARERQGGGTRVDSLRVELQLGQAQVRLENTREQLLAAQQEFMDLMGWSPDEDVLELAPAGLALSQLPELAAGYHLALSNRLDYAQVTQELRDADRAQLIARRSLWPDLRLTTAYERSGDGTNRSDALGFEDDTWFAGLTVGSDLRQTREEGDVAIAGTGVELARISIRDTQFRISRQIRDRIAACRRSRAEYEISKRNAKVANDRLRLAKRLYELDRGSSFDVVDAEGEYVSAELAKFESRAAVSKASFRLLHAMGVLVEHPDELKVEAVHENDT